MTDATAKKTARPAAKAAPVAPLTFAERAAMQTAPAWRPEVAGEEFRGRLLGVREGKNAEFGNYPVLIFRNIDEDNNDLNTFFAVHAFHTILVDQLATIQPKRGDILHGMYLGVSVTNKTKNEAEKDQTTYHGYFVEREGDDNDNNLSGEWSFERKS